MQYKRRYISLIFLFCASILTAQNAVLTGKITEKLTGEPLISATIKVDTRGTISDFDGRYRLELPAGEYIIAFSYVGYDTHTQRVTLTSGEEKVIDVALSLSQNLLQAATVTTGKFEKALGEVTVSLDIIKPSFIKNSGETAIDGVLDKMPGVAIIDGQPNIRGGAGYSYGAGSRVLLLIDDVPFLTPDAGAPSWKEVPFENIGQVEVVKGAASTLYGSSALNGIINVRTAYAKTKPVHEFSIFHTRYLAPEDKDKQWWTTPPNATGASCKW